MSQQFNPQFISTRVMPLVKRMLTDARKPEFQYLRDFFVNEISEKIPEPIMIRFTNDYFNAGGEQSGVPFSGSSPEAKADRENFLKFLAKYMRGHATGRINQNLTAFSLFMPDAEGKFEKAEKYLYNMALDIGGKIEREKLHEIIANHAKSGDPGQQQTAAKAAAALEKGKLILVKGPDQQFSEYMFVGDLGPTDSVVQSLPPSTATTLTKDGTEVVSNSQNLQESFGQHRAQIVLDELPNLGFQITPDPSQVKSGENILNVKVDSLPDDTLKITFTFRDGNLNDQSLIGKEINVLQNELQNVFTKPDGSHRSAQEIFQENTQQKTQPKSSAPTTQIAPQSLGQTATAPATVPSTPVTTAPPSPSLPTSPALPTGGMPNLPTARKAPLPPAKPTVPQGALLKPSSEIKRSQFPKSRPVPGIPAGSLMHNKEAFKQSQDPQAEDQAAFGAPDEPTDRNAISRNEPAVQIVRNSPPKKSYLGKMVVAANAGGIFATLTGGFLMGGTPESATNSTTALVFHSVKEVLVALSNYLPHFFT